MLVSSIDTILNTAVQFQCHEIKKKGLTHTTLVYEQLSTNIYLINRTYTCA